MLFHELVKPIVEGGHRHHKPHRDHTPWNGIAKTRGLKDTVREPPRKTPPQRAKHQRGQNGDGSTDKRQRQTVGDKVLIPAAQKVLFGLEGHDEKHHCRNDGTDKNRQCAKGEKPRRLSRPIAENAASSRACAHEPGRAHPV